MSMSRLVDLDQLSKLTIFGAYKSSSVLIYTCGG